MSDFKVPMRDMQFVMDDVLSFDTHFERLGQSDVASPDIVSAIMEECSKFCENVLAPLNASGDEEGCTWKDGEVLTPTGFKEAYQQFVEAGWPSMTHNPEMGGQGLPESLGTMLSEMCGSANWSWGMYTGLSHGAMKTLDQHGTDEQRNTYLTKLVEGSWTGTMCLTESHCGSDLGMLRTKAEPDADGSYSITGTKIFISAGEHDMSDNIVHIVLARLPGAPEGTKGISLFVVPKFLPNDTGEAGERNAVNCGSIEHKMGIHGNATCVMNFDNAKGFLIGEPNRGLNCMFTFMNAARIGTAVQGLAHAQIGYQKSLEYAKDRTQFRSLGGVKNPDAQADAIIWHPDVRRMLLTQKAFAEGGRMLIYFTSQLIDIENLSQNEEEKKEAGELLAFLTPIGKAFLTEVGFESANLGLQCFGGHGYIKEWGVEQNVRDSRISMLYEGTTGIQALDLLGRKVLMSQGEMLKRFTKMIHTFCKENESNEAAKEFVEPLVVLNKEWGDLTMHIGLTAMESQEEVSAASCDYLMYSGYITLGYFWARAALAAMDKCDGGEAAFYQSKIKTARFYFQRILPRTNSLAVTMKSGANNLMDFEIEEI